MMLYRCIYCSNGSKLSLTVSTLVVGGILVIVLVVVDEYDYIEWLMMIIHIY